MISVVYWCKLYVKTRTNFDAFQCIISKSSCAAAHQYTIIFTSMLFVGSLFNTIRYIIWVTWIGIIKKKHFYVGQETYLLLHDKTTAHFLLFTNPWDEMMLINSSGMTIPETALYVVFQILYLKNEHEVYFAENSENQHIHSCLWYNKELNSIPWTLCSFCFNKNHNWKNMCVIFPQHYSDRLHCRRTKGLCQITFNLFFERLVNFQFSI